MKGRYLLTDLGIVSALGCGVEETALRLKAGDTSGMKRTDCVLADGESTFFGFAAMEESAFAGAPTRVGALLDAAMSQIAPALARLELAPERIGAVVGSSNSTMEEFTSNPDRIDMSYPAGRLAEKWGVKGPAWVVSTACSSSAKVFASARRLLAEGLCDAVVVGGADAFTRIVVNGFHSLEAMSPRLTRPLAADRDGINLGEGAALFIMRRAGGGEEGIALLGVGETSDAYHLTAPDPEGRGAEASMRAALADAGLAPSDVDYINLHGTGTQATLLQGLNLCALRTKFQICSQRRFAGDRSILLVHCHNTCCFLPIHLRSNCSLTSLNSCHQSIFDCGFLFI